MEGSPGGGNDELARDPVAIAHPAGGDGIEVFAMHGLSGRLVEAAVGERHRAAAKHRRKGRFRRCVGERGRHAFQPDVGEARLRHGARERVPGAQLEEQRTDLGGDARVGDRKDRGPAASLASAPHGGGHAAAGSEQPAHLAQRACRIRHIHEPEGAHGGIEARIREGQRLGIVTPELDVADAPSAGDARGRLHHPLGDVRPDHAALLADGRGEAQADQPGAAGDIEHPLAGLRRHHVEHQVMRGRKLRLPALLVGADRAIPAVALDAPLKFRIHPVRLPRR